MRVDEIQKLGFEWPKYPIIEEYCLVEDGLVDLNGSLKKMRWNRDYYQKQIDDAYNFKVQTGADYSDFTDKFDDYVRLKNQLRAAIAYLEEIIATSRKTL